MAIEEHPIAFRADDKIIGRPLQLPQEDYHDLTFYRQHYFTRGYGYRRVEKQVTSLAKPIEGIEIFYPDEKGERKFYSLYADEINSAIVIIYRTNGWREQQISMVRYRDPRAELTTHVE